MFVLANRIKELREKQKLTQDDVAKRLGINRVSFSHYESGKNIPPSDKLSIIADILHTSADYLLGKIDDPTITSRQFYFDLESGESKLATVEETLQMFKDYEYRNKILAIKEHIDFIENVKEIDYLDKHRIIDSLNESIELLSVKNKTIPLVGTICAGDGLLAEQNIEDYVVYPLVNSKKHPDFALRVKGDSMIGAGINDGDIVYLRKTESADFNGQIVAAFIPDKEEGILKRIKFNPNTFTFVLTPENDKYEPIELKHNEVLICGTYMGHFNPEQTN